MPLDFPSSPVTNQIYTSGGVSWIWNGSAWDVLNTTDRIRRGAVGGTYSYCGSAPRLLGSTPTTESDTVWTIWRIGIASNGSVTSEQYATNVNWANYLTHSYI